MEKGEMMYENFRKLIEQRGITSYRVSMDTGIAQSSLSDWKNGRSKPKLDKLLIIADYLGVSVEELIDIGTIQKKSKGKQSNYSQ